MVSGQRRAAPDRAGIGSQLVALAKHQRPPGLELWTFQANTCARKFYERCGFAETGSTAGDDEEGAPDVRNEWLPSAVAPLAG